MDPLTAFAVAPPGVEPVVATELRGLGIHARVEHGGVTWHGDFDSVLRANLLARTPTRVLVRIAEFNARTFHELERHGRRVPWVRYLGDRMARLRVTTRKSKLYHQGAVAQRLHEALAETTGRAALEPASSEDVDAEDAQLFVVRIVRDRCTISADASGARLHVRGYRQALAKAPLRENLAAAMLLASGWDRRAPLVDPLCGSGTLPIEAALLARDIAPGLARADRSPRPFACTNWADFDDGTWQRIVRDAVQRILPSAPGRIIAADQAGGAVRATRANAERAGVADDLDIVAQPLDDFEPPAESGWLVTNPPYGVRVGAGGDAAATARLLDRLADGPLAGWTVARLVARGPARGDVAFETRNGGIAVRFVVRPPRRDG